MAETIYSPLADDIGILRAKIAELKEELNDKENELIDTLGAGSYEGKLYRVTATLATRRTTAWKRIAEKLGASRQIITANTSKTEYWSIRPFARKANLKRAA